VSAISATAGPDAFVAGLDALGIETTRQSGLVVYELEPFAGTRAGQLTLTGVEVGELSRWPTTPVHWIHVPASLNIPGSQPSPLAGWLRYSRPHPGRVDAAANPVREWVAHVREFLGHAA
jgi:hypothetical protein